MLKFFLLYVFLLNKSRNIAASRRLLKLESLSHLKQTFFQVFIVTFWLIHKPACTSVNRVYRVKDNERMPAWYERFHSLLNEFLLIFFELCLVFDHIPILGWYTKIAGGVLVDHQHVEVLQIADFYFYFEYIVKRWNHLHSEYFADADLISQK